MSSPPSGPAAVTRAGKAHRRGVLQAGLAFSMAGAGGALAAAGPPPPWGATPSPRQERWHGLERYAFVHFSLNTFTGKEWGYGDEAPALFDPSDFDADQIVAAARSASLRGLILVCKHHDGFCLWPSAFTDHSVRNSPYRQGRGDIVREVSDACRRAGLAFGVYLSPWDRHRADYGSPAYVEHYCAQLTELCTQYGPLFEVWFDEANGGDGFYGGARETRRIDGATYYDWPRIFALVRRLQPTACTFNPPGADIRWAGDEDGVAGDPCWPTLPPGPYTAQMGHDGVRGAPRWQPAEADVSLRPGWFWHEGQDAKVKTPQELMSIFDASVGRGANLILNLPPDCRGRIPDRDRASLQAFGEALEASFATDLAAGARAQASAERGAGFEAARAIDGAPTRFWCAPDGVRQASLTLTLPGPTPLDLIRLKEPLRLGARIDRFALEVDEGQGFREVAALRCIAARRIVRLERPVRAQAVRLRVLEAAAPPAIAEFALFLSRAPRALAPLEEEPRRTPQLSQAGWRVTVASAPGAQALVAPAASRPWRAPAPVPGRPVEVEVDLGGVQTLAAISLAPPPLALADASPPGRVQVFTRLGAGAWTAGPDVELSNIANARTPQVVGFAEPIRASALRLVFPTLASPAAQLALLSIGGVAP